MPCHQVSRDSRRTRFLAAVLVLGSVRLATAVPVSEPLWVGRSTSILQLKRSTSKDASCPSGYLCEQEPCPNGVICPGGEACINFEGTIACVPQDSSWCALQPDTFQGVGCLNSDICCHGNCYSSDAICCENPSVQCEVGKPCNVCAQGQTCGTGATTCQGDQPPPATTISRSATTKQENSATKPTDQTIKPTDLTTKPTNPVTELTKDTTEPVNPATKPTDQTTKQTDQTTKPTEATTKPTNPATKPTDPTTAVPTVPTKPTIVQSVGSFTNKGCYFDQESPRVLIGDKLVDAAGMTVEKCIQFARDGYWQYAGVEFGQECFAGNSLHGASQSVTDNCNQACSGNQKEVCGAGNRIGIYQDSTWFDPTADQLISVMKNLIVALDHVRQDIADYGSILQQWQATLARKRSASYEAVNFQSRSETGTQTEEQSAYIGSIMVIATEIEEDSQHLQYAAEDVDLSISRATFDSPRAGNPLTTPENVAAVRSAASRTIEMARDVIELLETNVDAINEAGDSIPELNVEAGIAVASEALGTLGISAIATGGAEATGIFLVFWAIIASLGGSGNNGGSNPTTIVATKTTATIRTSTTSTSTEQCDIVDSTPVVTKIMW